MLPRWLFQAERAALLASLFVLWLLAASQILAWRFTPRRRWIGTKVGLICVAVAALIVDTIRAPDMSAGFGIHSLTTQRMLYQQFGASTLPAVVLILLATAKSLSVQLGRPLPPVFPRLMWTFVVINQLFVLPSMIGNVIATRDNNPDGLMFWWAFNMWRWACVAWLQLLVHWCLFVGLRRRVDAFLLVLEQQEARRTQATAAVVAAAAAVTAVQESKRAARDKATKQERGQRQEPEASDLMDQSATAAVPPISPLLESAVPSDCLVELSEYMSNGDGHDSVAKLNAPRRSSTHSTAQSSSSPTVASSSSLLQLPTFARSSLRLPQSASSSASFSSSSSPGGNAAHSVTVRIGDSSAVSSSATGRLVRPTLAQVAPAPSSSSRSEAATSGSASAAVPQAVAAATAASQSEARLIELRKALSKLNLITLLMSAILLGTSCVPIPNLVRYAHGEVLQSIVHSPTGAGDGFPWLSGATNAIDMCAILTIIWYAWTSPRVWMAEARRASGLRFWHTLLHGVEESARDRYAAAEHAVMSKRTESITAAARTFYAPAAPSAHTAAAIGTVAVAAPVAANQTRNAW